MKSATDEFDAIQAEDEGVVADLNITDTSAERRGMMTSTKFAIQLGTQAAKDAFKSCAPQRLNVKAKLNNVTRLHDVVFAFGTYFAGGFCSGLRSAAIKSS